MTVAPAELELELPASYLTERHSLITWQVLSALGLKRLAKLESTGFSAGAEPVELHPLSALFTAWRAARKAG